MIARMEDRRGGPLCVELSVRSRPWRAPNWLAHRVRPLLFAAILSGLNSALVSGASTFRVLGAQAVLAEPYRWLALWLKAYAASWPLAFPAVLILSPLVRRIVDRLFPQRDPAHRRGDE